MTTSGASFSWSGSKDSSESRDPTIGTEVGGTIGSSARRGVTLDSVTGQPHFVLTYILPFLETYVEVSCVDDETDAMSAPAVTQLCAWRVSASVLTMV